MPLGLARDSMLDLADLAKKVEDGEFKTSFEIAEAEDALLDLCAPAKDGMTQSLSLSPSNTATTNTATQQHQQPGSITESTASNSNSASNSTSTNAKSNSTLYPTQASPTERGESKVPDPSDCAVNDEDERASVASSSIDSDIVLHSSTPTTAVHPSINGAGAASTSTSSKQNHKSTEKDNHGRYSGFHTVDYDQYYQPDYTAYAGSHASSNLLLGGKNESKPLWCCFFPWIQQEPPKLLTDEKSQESVATPEAPNTNEKETLVTVNTTPPTSAIARVSSKEEDETSIGSDALGERLSDKDRQAVLARLRLAQPDATNTTTSTSTGEGGDADQCNGSHHSASSAPINGKKGLLNGIHLPPSEPTTGLEDPATSDAAKTSSTTDAPNQELANGSTTAQTPTKAVRGILRQHSRMSRNNLQASAGATQQSPNDRRKRRSLFPSYSETTTKKKDVNVQFSPMARVLSVKSHKDMEGEEKGSVWWQKNDYEEFRKTGRMITKAMLEGGSEIWLATNRSWQMPNQARSTTLKHATSLAERQAAKKKGANMQNSKKEYEATRDKWWHKFGHSRRGLEHIASIDEGRQRQANVRSAIKAVVEENKRQKAFFRQDADKLRMVSLQHTTWARDLAMAAGASDADAVHTNFNDESRKSREFYLLKFSRAQQQQQQSIASKSPKMVPAFMRPAASLTIQPNRLDANTISQIRYRQSTNKKKLVSVAPSAPRRLSSAAQQQSASTTSKLTKKNGPAGGGNASTNETQSMAKKAAGYASGEAVANMSAVLTGMGPLPKSAAVVGSA